MNQDISPVTSYKYDSAIKEQEKDKIRPQKALFKEKKSKNTKSSGMFLKTNYNQTKLQNDVQKTQKDNNDNS